MLARAIAEGAQFTLALAELKKKGAAPWLIDQLMKPGPSKGTIKLARKYATDADALAKVNAQAAQLDTVSNAYGSMTADPRMPEAATWSPLTSTQSRTLQINVGSLDSSVLAQETTRVMAHKFESLAMGAGI